MAHEHSHDTDTYYLDQLCMIGITGAFAGVCLTLYFGNPAMLQLLLQDQFHPMILAAGFALLVVVLLRAAVLWKAAGAKPAAHVHEHAHEHTHHDHDGHHHEHGEHCGHDHDHHHHHGHEHEGIVAAASSPALRSLPVVAHEHDHGADDGHDHGWAPWRYVVLMVPMMLFLLGLPSKAMPLAEPAQVEVKADWGRDATQVARLIGLQGNSLSQAGFAGTMTLDAVSAIPIDFKDLEQLAFIPSRRDTWKDKKVQVTGQFIGYPGTERVFFVSRLRIQCCGADAIQLNVPVYSRENVTVFKKEDWVRVTGRIDFREQPNRPGVFQTVLVVSSAANVAPTNKDIRPYIN